MKNSMPTLENVNRLLDRCMMPCIITEMSEGQGMTLTFFHPRIREVKGELKIEVDENRPISSRAILSVMITDAIIKMMEDMKEDTKEMETFLVNQITTHLSVTMQHVKSALELERTDEEVILRRLAKKAGIDPDRVTLKPKD